MVMSHLLSTIYNGLSAQILLRLSLPVRNASIRTTLKLLRILPASLDRAVDQPCEAPNIELHRNRPISALNQHRYHLRSHSAAENWKIVLRRCSVELAHCFDKSRLWVSSKGSGDIDARVDHEVAGTEHQCRDAGDGGDFFDVLEAFDGLDLRNDAHMVVGSRDVEGVVRVQGLCEAGCESPGTEGSLSNRTCCSQHYVAQYNSKRKEMYTYQRKLLS
jgi:hypothetical protein